MRFEPCPPNDFDEFLTTYYDESRARVPQIAGVAGKWRFEDLIPGLSDIDLRFIVEDGMSIRDWCDMSSAVGEVHLDLCRRAPHWARNLEHLPGMNLMWSELLEPDLYSPEYAQWTLYRAADSGKLRAAEAYLANRPWGPEDERFHLGRFCQYYGPYNPALDPPINLGRFEIKHALHGRLMHYFCPPLHSALCILEKRAIRGKMEAIRAAQGMFPEVGLFREIEEVVDRHYEVPELYEARHRARLEERLQRALEMLRDCLVSSVAVVPAAAEQAVSEWQAALDGKPASPVTRAAAATQYARLMKGRLRFYASAPPHFDSVWLIENELLRLRRNFFEAAFGAYWEVTRGQVPEDMSDAVHELRPHLLTEDEVRCVQEFVRLLPGHWDDGQQKAIAQALADVFDGFFSAQSKVAAAVRRRSEGTAQCR